MNQVRFEPTGARILVTGATGLIGGGLARRLLTVGAEVRALVRQTGSASGLRAEGMDVAIGDMTDPSSLAKAVRGCDAVAHFCPTIQLPRHGACRRSARMPRAATKRSPGRGSWP